MQFINIALILVTFLVLNDDKFNSDKFLQSKNILFILVTLSVLNDDKFNLDKLKQL